MGAWGYGVFEDDSALDFLEEEFLGAQDPRPVMARAFSEGSAPDLDYERGCAVLVCAAVLSALVEGNPLDDSEDPEWAQWRTSLPTLDYGALYAPAAKALKELLGPGSELRELWEENEEDYPAWVQQVLNLLEWASEKAGQGPAGQIET